MNTYGYVSGNPIKWIDPTGEAIQGAVIGGAVRLIGGRAAAGAVGSWMRGALGPTAGGIAACLTVFQCSSWHDDAEDAGEEAADEMDEDGQCPVAEDSGQGPNCQENGRQCTEKCIKKDAGKGPRGDWITVCRNKCMMSRGCSPQQF